MTLPTDIDADYPDDPARPGRKLHQQHHDALHAFANLWEGIDPDDIGGGAHTHPESEVTDLVADLAAKETPAGATAKVTTHAGLTTGVHGVGASTVESAAGAQAKVDTHRDVAAPHAGHETPAGAQAKVDVEAAARATADALLIPLAQKAAANGVATLDAGSKIPSAQLPPLAIGETFSVASEAAMLALTAQRGDIAIRTDLTPDGVFILTTDNPGTLADWVQITAPGAVLSVDGRSGTVSLSDLYDALGAAAAAQAAAVQRANHTGTQAAATISDFTEAVQDVAGAMVTDGTTVNFTYDDGAGTLTAEVQGLTSASLSDFAEAVRDRLGATLVAGTGVSVTVDDPGDTVTVASTITQYTDEQARDALGTALVAGNNIDITVADGADTITVAVEALTSADVGDFAEAVDDRVNALLVAGANVTLTYDDVANTLTVASSGGGGAPSGPAGGVLSGTYPNPGFASDMATQAELDAEAVLARNADNLTSGTVADARIAATIARDSEVTSAVTAHEGAADPHAGYQRESEKDANSGYVGLAAAQGTRNGTKFLRDDGTWQAASGGVSDGDKGDITVSASGATWTVDNNAITLAKLADIATARILGRTTAGSGDPEELTAAQALGVLGVSAFVQTVLDDADQATALATLGAVPLSVIDAADDLIVGSGADAVTRLAVGASRIVGKKATGGLDDLTPAEANAILAPLLHVRDEKAQNTAGGTFTSGAWQVRTLNTVKTNDIAGASLASDTITLPAGTYEVAAIAPGVSVARHQARLYNVTGAAVLVPGTSMFASTSASAVTVSFVRGQFTLASQSDVRLEHRAQTTRASDGFGIEANLGTEVYAEVQIWKVG